MKIRKILAFAMALIMTASLAGCGGSSSGSSGAAAAPAASAASSAASSVSGTSFEPMTWSAATSGADSSNFAAGLYKFGELLKERTGGAITLNVFPSDQLTNGNAVDSLQAEMEGTIDVTFQADGIWSNFDPRFNVLILPFLFSTTDQVDEKLFNGAGGQYMIDMLEKEQGVKCLGIGENGFRYITNSKHEVCTPDDLKDLKLRVGGSPLLTRTYELWNVDYTTANWAEVYTGLQTGLYDGQENPVAVVHASSIQEVQKYVTAWTAQYSCMFLTMNGDLFNSLSDELKQIVEECGAEACAYQVELTRQQCEDYLKVWESDYGMQVHYTTEDEVAQFKALSDPIYEEAVSKYGFTQDLLDMFID
ncbi:TRAP transporter substrate-binding protein DctP [Dysosmobacter sp.]|uniref:TRAP transporter substrate-binding protein DctP n=1 Tax=Dysosmobacter sp. TaxID=2591382 RepID=UPI002A8E0053|nr:TRAP transporter substrate-binding protein DctP [Dysosmobacter sp.]MDY3282759.1 TRAP transporter substrate-binding protein DctP [Dysosmobacter sp.]